MESSLSFYLKTCKRNLWIQMTFEKLHTYHTSSNFHLKVFDFQEVYYNFSRYGYLSLISINHIMVNWAFKVCFMFFLIHFCNTVVYCDIHQFRNSNLQLFFNQDCTIILWQQLVLCFVIFEEWYGEVIHKYFHMMRYDHIEWFIAKNIDTSYYKD